MKPELSKDRLNDLFRYADGLLISKVKVRSRNIDDIVGSNDGKGYLAVRVDGVSYLVHRVIFMMHNGYLPKFLDHIDGDRKNNRIENLREASNTQNQWNQKRSARNKSGYKGVSWESGRNKWRAGCKINTKAYNLGYYDDPLVAFNVVKKFRENNHKEFACHG